MKESITTLSKAVQSLQPKTGAIKLPATPSTTPPTKSSTPWAKGTNLGKKPPHTYATLAASPARPSAVVDLGKTGNNSRSPPIEICKSLNRELAASTHSQVRIAAARWTVHGNLVITAGHTTSPHQLNSALTFIAFYLKNILGITADSSNIPIRTNIKWSRLLLNRIPTGITDKHGAYSPDTCHNALMADNPAYASLTITQRPSWVKDPSSYKTGSMYSLSFAFEDPDGSLALKLLSEKELYILGSVATIKKWKQKPPKAKPTQTPSDANTQTEFPQLQPRPEQLATPRPTRKTGPTPNTRSNTAKVQAPRAA
jgi:hypothetical protein